MSALEDSAGIYRKLSAPESAAQRQRRVREAAQMGQSCGQCGRPLAASEAVWRVPLRVESEMALAPQLLIAPICSSCRPWPAAGRQPRPCSGCGRGVIADADDYWPWAGHTFCSDRCAARWWDHNRLQEGPEFQPAAGGLQAVSFTSACLACGRPVIGRRTTCGVACRQRLYRLRKREGIELSRVQSDGHDGAPAGPGIGSQSVHAAGEDAETAEGPSAA